MQKIAKYDEILDAIKRTSGPIVVGIDGRACSGKSTLARKLISDLNAVLFQMDDLFIPFNDQPKDMKPAFPFPYFRNDVFHKGVSMLSTGKPYSYYPYDWHTDTISTVQKFVQPARVTLVEGISVLSSTMAQMYHIRIFVLSDVASQLTSAMDRDGEKFEPFWRLRWIPSEELYMKSRPWKSAHFFYPGRGLPSTEEIHQYLR